MGERGVIGENLPWYWSEFCVFFNFIALHSGTVKTMTIALAPCKQRSEQTSSVARLHLSAAFLLRETASGTRLRFRWSAVSVRAGSLALRALIALRPRLSWSHRRLLFVPNSSRRGFWSSRAAALQRSRKSQEISRRRFGKKWLMAFDCFCASTKRSVNLRDSQERPDGPSSPSPSTRSESATGDNLSPQDSPYCGRSLEPSPSSLWGPDPWHVGALWTLQGPAHPHPETWVIWPDTPGVSPSRAVLKLPGPPWRKPS